MSTHIFKLPSGVECEVTYMVGKHQRLLTENSSSNSTDNLNKVLADVIIRVGSLKKIDEDFVLGMLAADRKKALVEVRQFTMDFEPTFQFNYDYKDSEGNKLQHELEVDLSEGFKSKNLMVINDQTGDIEEAPYKEYSEIKKEINLTLPKSGTNIVFSLLDGKGEQRGANTPKKQRSSHTAIMMRNPRELRKSEKNDNVVPIQLNLDRLPIKDIEFLRATIKEMEGSVDTEFMFEHPESDTKPLGEKDVVIDLISQMAFFFPSEAI